MLAILCRNPHAQLKGGRGIGGGKGKEIVNMGRQVFNTYIDHALVINKVDANQ